MVAMAAVTLAPAATPAEFVFGLGGDDVFRPDVVFPAISAEVRAEPRWHFGQAALGFGLAGEIDVDGDVWGGAGVVLTAPITPDWRFEASFMPGLYSQGSGGTDLGTSAPMFRTQIGVSYMLPSGWRLGAAINHKSNASTASYNPGVESLFLTLGREF
jgi:hypothetical protein